MNLPIDAREAPFREKYLDEETPLLARWIVFGSDRNDGTIHVSGPTDDVIVGLSMAQAMEICEVRKTFVDAIISIINTKQVPRAK